MRWAEVLSWQHGPGDVTRPELALDYELYEGQALLASPHHKLRGMQLPLGEQARVPLAMQLMQQHLSAGRLLQGMPSD